MAWGKSGTVTRTTTGDTTSFTMTASNIFNTYMYHKTAPSGNANSRGRFGSTSLDSGTNYAHRYNSSGGTDGTAINQTYGVPTEPQAWTFDDFVVGYFINIATEEKLIMQNVVESNTAGAGNAPYRGEQVAKWANTSNAADIMGMVNLSTGDYTSDDNLSALGSDLTPAVASSVTISDGAIFYETDTNKAYVIYNGSWTEL